MIALELFFILFLFWKVVKIHKDETVMQEIEKDAWQVNSTINKYVRKEMYPEDH